jgi:hypothetical protein
MPTRTSATARHLRIVNDDDRADITERVTEAVRQLDARIARDPSGSAVQVGETRKFEDPYDASRMSWVRLLVGNRRVVVIIPAELDTPEVTEAVDALIATAVAADPIG